MKVGIISRELTKPSSPTPSELRDFKLSFIDECIPPTYVPLILYYSYDENSNIKQSEMSNRLKESLSKVLMQFYPLAGRMKSQIAIDCNDEGVYYIEARVEAHLSDVMGLCTFINAWASMASGESNKERPIFNSSSLFPPRGSPDSWVGTRNPAIQHPVQKFVAKRFDFTATAIAALKAQVEISSIKLQPTRLEVVSALLWKCCMAAIGNKNSTTSVACLPVNLRRRMVPSLPDNSFGNIFAMANTVTRGETDFASLVGKLISQEGVEVFKISSWCRFPIYEVDFGWGKPTWVTTASSSRGNCIFLLDSRSAGGVEAWVILVEEAMEKLEQDVELQAFTTPSCK
ncbi:unnamed protein product [Ilex paraguariensis]|uniref:Uncharacterized protein n=1 Tax=Ilex paraguariensis TaxID=185542 RepID=A0ABC8RTL8_9AQUA